MIDNAYCKKEASSSLFNSMLPFLLLLLPPSTESMALALSAMSASESKGSFETTAVSSVRSGSFSGSSKDEYSEKGGRKRPGPLLTAPVVVVVVACLVGWRSIVLFVEKASHDSTARKTNANTDTESRRSNPGGGDGGLARPEEENILLISLSLGLALFVFLIV
jgi:hypothetical protein